jgi:tetratricopeptide (TPR) repeat protein
MIGSRWTAALLLTLGCMSPLEEGEQLYREGDRHGALAIWRSVEPSKRGHAQIASRVAEVEAELEQLVVRYVENARKLEDQGRLAESILDFRLALMLRPDDSETLDHVQKLTRELVDRKAALAAEYDRVLKRGHLEDAREALQRLRTLDPFDPDFETEERQLQAAINAEWRQRRARYRERLAGEVEGLVEAGREAFGEERLDAALDYWRRALLIDPDNERIQAYIARAERQLENLERLRESNPAEGGS